MSGSRGVLTAVAAWLAVVVVGSVLVWSVISRAGDVEPGYEAAVPAATEAPGAGSAPPPRPEPSSPRKPTAPPAPTARPTPSATSSSTEPTAPAESPAPSAATISPNRETERRTWQGPGGYVSAECRGQAISLVAAQADAGFVVEVDERGPAEVTVAFEGQGEEGRETKVSAACRAAVPDFTVSAED